MRIAMNIGSDVLGSPSSPSEVVADARRAEAEGFGSAWSVHFSRAYDALTTLAVAGTATEQIELGVGIVPTYPRHPVALAQQAATTQAYCGGRLTLGIGVSHRPVIEGLHGLPFTSPAAHMRDYLTVLGPLLRGEEVDFHGEHFQVTGSIAVPGTSAVSIVVGALSPRMLRVAGELSDGTITWLAGPRTLADTVVPALAQAASSAGRRPPRVVAGMPVAVSDDAAQARATAETTFARYGGLDNYRRVFEREGVASVGELAIVGDESEVEEQVRRFADVGVTELWPVPYPVGDDPGGSIGRTRALLANLRSDF